jgi:serine/threonine protein kinase
LEGESEKPQAKELHDEKPRVVLTMEKFLGEVFRLCGIGAKEHRQVGEFSLGKIIGRGAFAKVCLALDKRARTRVVFKIFEKSALGGEERESILNEIRILRTSEHRNIIRLLSALEDRLRLILVFEYNSAISLDFAQKLQRNQRYPEPIAKDLFRQMAEVTAHLHARDIVHRDIKLQNMLMTGTSVVQFIDFGFSRELKSNKPLTDFCGTPQYIAPEIV